jgi:DNA-binding CsgD family transcriptional regulator
VDVLSIVGLTRRKSDVLALLAAGKRNAEIGSELSLKAQTVNTHLDHIYAKLGVGGRTEATLRALHFGRAQALGRCPSTCEPTRTALLRAGLGVPLQVFASRRWSEKTTRLPRPDLAAHASGLRVLLVQNDLRSAFAAPEHCCSRKQISGSTNPRDLLHANRNSRRPPCLGER